MIIFINNKSTKFCQITLGINRFIHIRKLDLFSASRCIYDTRCYFNVQSKSDMSRQLNLPHETNQSVYSPVNAHI